MKNIALLRAQFRATYGDLESRRVEPTNWTNWIMEMKLKVIMRIILSLE